MTTALPATTTGIEESICAVDYKTRGNEVRLQDRTLVYISGKAMSKNGVIIIPDTFGWNSGRVRIICDFFGDHDLYAAIPNFRSKGIQGETSSYMDSSGIGDWYKSRTFDGNIKPIIQALIVFMKGQGTEKIALLGFGWGCWVVVNLLACDLAEEFCCGALSSPSIDLEERVYGGSLPELMSLVQRPLLFMPTEDDPDHYRSYYNLLKYRFPTSQAIDYHDLEAHFMLRGNAEKQANKVAIVKSLQEILNYFQQHFPMSYAHSEDAGERVLSDVSVIREKMKEFKDQVETSLDKGFVIISKVIDDNTNTLTEHIGEPIKGQPATTDSVPNSFTNTTSQY